MSATNLDALMREQGAMVDHFLGEDEINTRCTRETRARGTGDLVGSLRIACESREVAV
jgi:hypothetical protein